MKALTKISIGFLALAAAALWFTSCSSEDVAQNGGGQGNTYLTLSINTGDVSNTRASDWTGTDPVKTDENKINNMTVGIFDKNGKVRTIVDLAEDNTGKPNSYKLTTASGSTTVTATANIVTSSLDATDVVLVAVNAPAKKFAGVTSKNGFNAVKETLADAVASTTKETNTKIPMYGYANLTGSGSSFSASVDVYHMLAKVTLKSLTVDFKADGPYKSAEFTPTAFFMINVPEDFQFNGTVENKFNEAWTSTTTMYHAWNKDGDYTTTNDAATSMGTYAQYLTTGDLGITTPLKVTAGGTTSTNSCSKKACFYVTPSSATATGKKNMKLVIAGTFKNGETSTPVYYPVPLNANYAPDGTVSPAGSGTTTYAVYPNVDYQCEVVIRSIGATTPNADLSPETATIKVTVKDFVPVTQNTEFN